MTQVCLVALVLLIATQLSAQSTRPEVCRDPPIQVIRQDAVFKGGRYLGKHSALEESVRLLSTTSYVFHNASSRAIVAYAVYHSGGKGGPTVTINQHFNNNVQPFSDAAESYFHHQNESATVEIDYVLFEDGSGCGANKFDSARRMLLYKKAMDLALDRLRAVLESDPSLAPVSAVTKLQVYSEWGWHVQPDATRNDKQIPDIPHRWLLATLSKYPGGSREIKALAPIVAERLKAMYGMAAEATKIP